MLTTPTLDKLHALNLMGMARAFQEQLERTDYQALSFEERLGLHFLSPPLPLTGEWQQGMEETSRGKCRASQLGRDDRHRSS